MIIIKDMCQHSHVYKFISLLLHKAQKHGMAYLYESYTDILF